MRAAFEASGNNLQDLVVVTHQHALARLLYPDNRPCAKAAAVIPTAQISPVNRLEPDFKEAILTLARASEQLAATNLQQVEVMKQLIDEIRA